MQKSLQASPNRFAVRFLISFWQRNMKRTLFSLISIRGLNWLLKKKVRFSLFDKFDGHAQKVLL